MFRWCLAASVHEMAPSRYQSRLHLLLQSRTKFRPRKIFPSGQILFLYERLGERRNLRRSGSISLDCGRRCFPFRDIAGRS